jgi:malic enzyme
MTNREFYTAITAENATITDEMIEHAQTQLAKLDATAEKRKGKVSKADQEKRDANATLATKVAAEILTTEAKTATDVAAVLTEMLGEEVKVQKASYLCRLAVEMGLANQTEVKIPKKGTQKAYTAVEE